MLPQNVTKIPATLEQFLEESPEDWRVSSDTGKISAVIKGFVPNPLMADLPTPDTMPPMAQPEPLPNPFQQAPAAMIAHVGDVLEVQPLPKPKPPKQKKLKKYCFDVTGKIYLAEKHTSEQWEALKRKLGAVIEVEAANQNEAWKMYGALMTRNQKEN
jgi:hypothetical protein